MTRPNPLLLLCVSLAACRHAAPETARCPDPAATRTASAAAAPIASPAAAPAPSPAVARTTRGALSTEGVPPLGATLARLERYLDVRSASLGGWDARGGLYALTRLANVTQLHRVDAPLGYRRQLTFGAEGIDGFAADPRAPGGLVIADRGGDENTQLWSLDARGALRLLTDGKSRNISPVYSDDGARVVYSSTRRNDRDFDLWTMDPRAPDQPHQLAYEASGLWVAADWSPAGDRVLAVHNISETRSELTVIEPGRGVVQTIDPSGKPGTEVAFDAAAFGPGGRGVYYVSDAGGEVRGLWYRDLASGKDTLLTAGTRWDHEGLALSRDRAVLAVTVNEGGWSRLRLLDTRTQKFRTDPVLPPSIITSFSFAPDGKRLAFTRQGGREPGDLFVLDLARGQVTRWTESELGGLASEDFVVPQLVEYPSFDGRKIPAFVLTPRGPGPHPVVISIHGGPESQSRPYLSSAHQFWVNELGLAVILPNVRGSTGYGRSYTLLDNGDKREDSVKDIGALLDWIGAQPSFDAKRVAVFGGSYGGYMVLATGTNYPDRVAAIVDVVGISNFVTFLESTKEYRRDLRRVEYGDERNPEMRAFLERISPTNNAGRIRAPLFVVQGANDPRVPLTESEQMVAKVRGNGGDVWYMVAADEGHGFQKKDNRDAFLAATALFFEKHLLKR